MSAFPALAEAIGQIEIVLVGGLVATLVLSVGMFASQGLGYSRLSLPFLMGFFVTGRRSRAAIFGLLLYTLGGWIFAFLYAWFFAMLGRAGLLLGVGTGLLHGLFLLTMIMPLLPYFHPRVASPYAGPIAQRRLQPPGFLALNYGRMTPITTLLSHAFYGAILGWVLA
ncbi:hypothetical protein [Citreimonas salinaria]|uniref:Uncharacterized protein n=1 Tax=Citreimonas salinaria TaxID=321339 RepID=A0A1H3NF29_9RHOB|nr:hypothetical protein [Citreimonas salinaria]SDY87374.1 hypothetical protein SAMN05444340_12334 [Citreimonas salinaria]